MLLTVLAFLTVILAIGTLLNRIDGQITALVALALAAVVILPGI
jgi:NADH:ubiquinone oxidoreductase subunit K